MVNIDLSKVKLRFAMRNGRRVNIREFEQNRGFQKGRPDDLSCPECELRVFPVLSPTRSIRDHFRHESDSECSIRTSNESAVHFNGKAALAQELEKFQALALLHRCSQCHQSRPFLTIPEYDSVRVESTIRNRRPDVSCWLGGEMVGAAEVFYTHAVDLEKKAEMDSYGLPWFEIPVAGIDPQNFELDWERSLFSIHAMAAGVTQPCEPAECCECAQARDRPWEWLKDVNTLPAVWRLYARQVLDLTAYRHDWKCRGELRQGEGVIYCGACGSYMLTTEETHATRD